MTQHLKYFLRLFLGAILLILGLAGLFLPVLQGWLFITLGFVLLYPVQGKKLARKLKKKLKQKWVQFKKRS